MREDAAGDATVRGTATDDSGPVEGVAPGLGTRMGRYELQATIGSGGMGVVFAARDPELDRTVAVKVLHASTAEGEARMRREGQTMARLAHPNVIRVYDVGVAQGNMFVAMEYVEGGTLQEWLKDPARGPDEIVAAFVQAGRGLAAAHRAGLVHRDFKPSNALVGDDGRVMVTDFGLARPTGAGELETQAGHDGGAAVASSLLGTVTRTGGCVGTPAYMAPEQHAGATVDARADQFSFCVALWTAVYRAAPFEGRTREELAAAVASGVPVRPAPAALARVPSRIRIALERGLRPAPEDRFPSMDALLAALEPPRQTARAWWLGLAAAMVAVGAVLAVVLGDDGDRIATAAASDPCEARADRFRGVWDAETARAVEDAFVATGASYAEASFREVARQLDARRAAWIAMRHDSCRATKVHRQQSEAMMDLRASCLERRLDDLSAFVTELRAGGTSMVSTAAQQAAAIGDVTPCGDVATLGRRAPLPDDPAAREAIELLQRDIATLRARAAAGRHADLSAAASELIARARALDYAPVLADALSAAGMVENLLRHGKEAEELYQEAIVVAEAGGDDTLRLDAETALVSSVGWMQERHEDAEHHARRAEALLTRLGKDERRAAILARDRAQSNWWNGEFADAQTRVRQAIEAFRRLDPAGADLAAALRLRAVIELELDDLRGSEASCDEALAIAEPALGADHPLVAKILQTKSGALRRQDRFDEAHAAVMRALEIVQQTEGPDSIAVCDVTANIAVVYADELRHDEAIAWQLRALEIGEKSYGPEHSRIGDLLMNLSTMYSKAGRHTEALETIELALAKHRAAFGPDSTQVAASYRNKGWIHNRAGRPREARVAFLESIRALEASEGTTTPLLGRPLSGLGDAELALGRRAESIAAYTRALTLMTDPGLRAEVEASLAEARGRTE